MNVRLLIMFGLLIQLLTGHAPMACAAKCADATMETQPETVQSGCCKATESKQPSKPKDCPREVCPLCLLVGKEPNELAVLPLRDNKELFRAPRLLAWSVLIDDMNIRRALLPRRVHDPPPALLRREAIETGRWLL